MAGLDPAEIEKTAAEHIRPRSENDSPSPHHSTRSVKLEKDGGLLEVVDLSNQQAYKGDDSDGKVAWTLRKLLAAGFLCMLYTGKWCTSINSKYVC